jgi:hypothetical protein
MREEIYRQYDSRWGNLPYPVKSYSFANNGCGCCSVTHLVTETPEYYGCTPKDVRPYMVQFATKGHGTTWDGITKSLQHYGLDPKMHDGMQTAFNALAKMPKGRRAGILLFRAGTRSGKTWTSGGHYVAFLDYKVVNGKHYFYTKDSGARKNDGWHCFETQMEGLIKAIWTVELPAPQKGKYYDVGKTYVVVSGRNVRAGGALKYKKVGYLTKGTKVKCLQTSKNGRWIRHGTFRWSCGRSAGGEIYIK